MPRFEAVLGGAFIRASTMDGRRSAKISSLPGRAGRWAVGVALVTWLLCLQIRIMTEFFQIAGMSTPATDRLKSSIRKARPCSPRWRRWSMVSPLGPWVVEEPAFLMAAETPLSPNGLYERSTKWWQWMTLIRFLSARSCWTELAVNCLLKAV